MEKLKLIIEILTLMRLIIKDSDGDGVPDLLDRKPDDSEVS